MNMHNSRPNLLFIMMIMQIILPMNVLWMELPAWYIIFRLFNLNQETYTRIKISLMNKGAIVRMDTTKKDVYLCFTAHDFSDGFDTITRTFNHHKIKASFFLTGDFCKNPVNKKIITGLKTDGHYIGPHSDKHLLYCSWEKRDSLLVTRNKFLTDLENNYKELAKSGIAKKDALVFLPPYEWYNDSIAGWTTKAGIKLVNNSTRNNNQSGLDIS